ncbi:permease prefix domain 1-containing protein [Lentisphaerota bacterium ZTH]|nr:hypothetical protein JYG24_05575 [Lentisphaerota bacterium]WET07027.1 permease prefix domain 1-containing protein [Lentisphaerota bacterium ZTH]
MVKVDLDRFLDQLTAGLKADRELRMEVRQELATHIMDRYEDNLRMGLSDAESYEQAIKAFGNILELSDQLTEANMERMSSKSKFYRTCTALLIPALVICAFVMYFPGANIIKGMACVIKDKHGEQIFFDIFSDLEQADRSDSSRFTAAQRLILYGDLSHKNKSDRLKAVCDEFPQNKAFHAEYTGFLVSETDHYDKNNKEIRNAVKVGKEIDPNNALYNYILANYLFSRSCNMEYSAKTVIGTRLKITNRTAFDQALEEYHKGTQKKFYRNYAKELTLKRMQIFGKSYHFLDNLYFLVQNAKEPDPHVNYMCHIPVFVWTYAYQQAEAGNKVNVLKAVAPYKSYINQLSSGTNTLAGQSSAARLCADGARFIPEIYKRTGLKKQAAEVQNILSNTAQKIRTAIKKELKESSSQSIRSYMPWVTSVFCHYYSWDKFSRQQLLNGMAIEYIFAAKYWVVVMNTVLLMMIIGYIAAAFHYHRITGQKAVLLAPSARFIGKMLFFGVFIPVVTFFLVSNIHFLSGQNINIACNYPKFILQCLLLLAVILCIISTMIRNHISKRCTELDIRAANNDKTTLFLKFKYAFFIVLTTMAYFPLEFFTGNDIEVYKTAAWQLGVTGVIFIFLFALAAAVRSVIKLRKDKAAAIYYGSYAKTMVPVLALAVIVITAVIIPAIDLREQLLVKQDEAVYSSEGYYFPGELKLINFMKEAISSGLNKLPPVR